MTVRYAVTFVEFWRPVVGYEGLYEASTAGRIRRSGAGRGVRVGRILQPAPGSHGYLTVALYRGDGKARTVTVHDAVATAWLGSRPANHEVNHINGQKTDNDLRNLGYVTSSANKRHAYMTGLRQWHPQPRAANGKWVRA
jgi:hypothetical protein